MAVGDVLDANGVSVANIQRCWPFDVTRTDLFSESSETSNSCLLFIRRIPIRRIACFGGFVVVCMTRRFVVHDVYQCVSSVYISRLASLLEGS